MSTTNYSAQDVPHLERGPVVFLQDQRPICQLVKAPLLGSPQISRSADAPKLSGAQLDALQVVEEIARKHCVEIDRADSDIQFVNNLSIMHARSAYIAKVGVQGKARHLFRMFLRDPGLAWRKPVGFEENFERPFKKGREQELPVTDLDPWRKVSGTESHG